MLRMKLVLLALPRFKIGIGKRRSNKFAEFPRSCAPSDQPVVRQSDSSKVIQSFMQHEYDVHEISTIFFQFDRGHFGKHTLQLE